jgi:hypothetical protein
MAAGAVDLAHRNFFGFWFQADLPEIYVSGARSKWVTSYRSRGPLPKSVSYVLSEVTRLEGE